MSHDSRLIYATIQFAFWKPLKNFSTTEVSYEDESSFLDISEQQQR